jgi:hypothetical protein
MSDRDSSPSKHVLNATLLHKGNTVTAILSSGRQLLSLPIPPQVQYHESVMSTLLHNVIILSVSETQNLLTS